jgi:hypothetical protein
MVVMVVEAEAVEQARPAAIQDLLAPHLQEESAAPELVVLFQEQLHIMPEAVAEEVTVDLMPVMVEQVVAVVAAPVMRHKVLVVLTAEPMVHLP